MIMRNGRNKKHKLKPFHKTAVILLKCIDSKPGVRYRQLLRKTNLTNSVLSYHLGNLEKSKSIKVDRSRYGRTSYYPTYVNKRDWRVIERISNSTSIQLIQFLMSREYPSRFKEIVRYGERAPSTISYHLKRLTKARIVSVDQNRIRRYRLINKARILRILSQYGN
jgi:predicted transcriptional regulator